jgi:hypothetical protein
MVKLIKACKIICIAFAVSIFGDLFFSIILNIIDPIEFVKVSDYYVMHSPKFFLPAFFGRLAEVSVYYLFIIFIEKWCIKNDVK